MNPHPSAYTLSCSGVEIYDEVHNVRLVRRAISSCGPDTRATVWSRGWTIGSKLFMPSWDLKDEHLDGLYHRYLVADAYVHQQRNGKPYLHMLFCGLDHNGFDFAWATSVDERAPVAFDSETYKALDRAYQKKLPTAELSIAVSRKTTKSGITFVHFAARSKP